jgi:hypothetical protein
VALLRQIRFNADNEYSVLRRKVAWGWALLFALNVAQPR